MQTLVDRNTPEPVPDPPAHTPPAADPEALQPDNQLVIPPHPMQTRSKDGIFKPNPKYGLTSILTEIEPVTYTQALKDRK